MKKILIKGLTFIEQFVYSFAETCPAEIKFSRRNYIVASIALFFTRLKRF